MRAHSTVWFVVPALAASIPLADRASPSSIHQPISPTITEYVIPRPGNFPHDPAVAADGSVWYTDQRNSYIGHLDPETGKIVDFATPTPGSGPHGLTVAPDGSIWYTGQGRGLLGRVNPETGKINPSTRWPGTRPI